MFATTSTIAAVISSPALRAEPRAAPEERRELAGLREHPGEAARGVERRVHRRRGREQRRDRHHREAGVAERRPRRLGDRRLAVVDHLRDGERPEHAERDQDVEHGRHAERAVHRVRQLSGRVAQVAGGERDHAEAEVGEEREGDARDDVVERRVAVEREQPEVDVHDRDRDEDGEDGEQHDDDQRLGAVHERGADEVDAHHHEHDHRREEVVPARRRVVADEERGRVAAERDRDHRADDHDRGEVAEPGGDADEPPVAEPLDQVRDQPARGREAHAELDDGVAEQGRDDSGDQEREPDRGAGDRAGLAEQGEDAGADHRADAEERGAADAHAHGAVVGAVVVGTGGAGVWSPKNSQTIRKPTSAVDHPRDLQRELEGVVDDALAERRRAGLVGLGGGDLRAVGGEEEHAGDGGPHGDHVARADPEREPERDHRPRRGRLARRQRARRGRSRPRS